jgi:superfamily I DNA and RNA helicase
MYLVHIWESIFEHSSSCVDPVEAMAAPKISVGTGADSLDARLAQLNEPQRQAVVGILESRCRPKPYIVSGPPGTGKTHTLVEAIVQIYCRDPSARILFCANSNTCADQVVEEPMTHKFHDPFGRTQRRPPTVP